MTPEQIRELATKINELLAGKNHQIRQLVFQDANNLMQLAEYNKTNS